MPRVRPTLLLLAVLSLFASACAGGNLMGNSSGPEVDGLPMVDLEASREFVLASAQRTEATSYRFEASISMLMDMGFVKIELDGDEPMMTGLFDGERTSLRADLGVMFDEMADSDPMFEDALQQLAISRDQLIIDAVVDGTKLYLHAPIFAVPGMDAGLGADLRALANGWGHVNLAQVTGFGIDDITSLSGANGVDPTAVLDLLDLIGAEVRPDGAERVRGVETTRLIAPVSLGDLLATQGDPSEMIGGFGADAGLGRQLDEMMATSVDITVNVDVQGLVRRVAYDIDLGEAFGSLMTDQVGDMFGEIEMRMGMALDFIDYGHPDTVQVPEYSTDITAMFLNLATWAS